MNPMPAPLTIAEATALARLHERGAHSPLAAPCLLLDLGSTDDGDRDRLADWLRELPAPVIGYGRAHDNTLVDLCDVRVPTLDEAAPLLDNIRRCPIAAMTLVQLLRFIEALPLADALVAESLAYATLQNGAEFRAWREATPPAAPAPQEDGPAVVMTRDDDVLSLWLNRPANHNAMTVEMRDALGEALQLAASDPSIARVRIRGRGKCFSTGGDLREFGTAPDPATAHLVRSLALPGRWLAAVAGRSEACVHGACVGSGIEFPAFAGRLVATRDAWFQLPELKFGLIPGAGGCVSITRRIGRQHTAWLVLSGRRIDAVQAQNWGLVDAVVDAPPDDASAPEAVSAPASR
ncbi:MAG: enoyl-CoA hydratase/isomerase family protein [Solimonas sp.]